METTGTRLGRCARQAPVAVLAVVYALLVFLTLTGLREPELPDLTRPLIKNDYALHYAVAERGGDVLARRGFLYGYDPDILCGEVMTPYLNPSDMAGVHAVALAPRWARGLAFNAAALLHLLLLPLVAGWIARRASTAPGAAPLAAAVAITAWWTGFGAFCTGGMYGFGTASVLGVVLVAALCLSPPPLSWRRALSLGAVAGLALLYHPGAVVICGPPAVAYLVAHCRRLALGDWLRLAASLGVVALLNVTWLLPAVAAHVWSTGTSTQTNLFAAPTLTSLLGYLGAQYARGSVVVGAFKVALLVLGARGILRLPRPARWPALTAAAWLAFVTFGGGGVPALRALQPLRFQAPLEFLLSAAAATWLAQALGKLSGGRAAGWLATVAFLAATMVSARQFLPRLRTSLPAELSRVVETLRRVPAAPGRVLVEDASLGAAIFPEGKFLVNACLDIEAGHPTLAGLFANHCFPRRSESALSIGYVFGRPFAAFEPPDLAAALDDRAVVRVITFSPEAEEAFRATGMRVTAREGRFAVLDREPPGYAAEGPEPLLDEEGIHVRGPGLLRINCFVEQGTGFRGEKTGLAWPQLRVDGTREFIPWDDLVPPLFSSRRPAGD